MQHEFALEGRDLREVAAGNGSISIFSAPTPEERRALIDVAHLDPHDLDSALDPEEISRFDFDPASGRTTIIWKRPDPRADGDATRFEVASVGIFLHEGRVLIVAGDDRPPISAQFPELDSPIEFVLRMMLATVQEFQSRLRVIKRTSREIQARLNSTIDNRALVRMFDLSEDLVYYADAIDANTGVLTKLRNASGRLGLTEGALTLLDDLMIDNEQCSRQGHNYTRVLGGLLDARGNIVNNNMNVLIKNLTVVNVVFLPLGVIVSMGGMSEFTMMLDDYGIPQRVGYPLFAVALVVLGILILRLVTAWIERRTGGGASTGG